jgi:hypothetical protein
LDGLSAKIGAFTGGDGVVLAPWHIRSKNSSFSQNGCAKEPAQVLPFLQKGHQKIIKCQEVSRERFWSPLLSFSRYWLGSSDFSTVIITAPHSPYAKITYQSRKATMTTMQYSKRLGTISTKQFQAALDHFNLGQFMSAEAVPFGLFGQNVFVTSTAGEFVLRGAAHYDWQLPKYNAKLKRVGMENRVPLVVLKRNFLSYTSRR